MKKFFLKNWPIILIFTLSILVVWPLFIPGYFSHHDDLQVMRVFEMRKCFTDLQLPCRWVSDMGFGNGYPLFNFYGPLPYYLGALVSYITGYIGAAKVLFFLPLVFGAIGMYILAKELFGKVPGFTASILFLFVPYRALDSYVRGAIGESFGLAIIPFVFYFYLQLIKLRNRKYFTLAALSTFLFFVSHNIMTLIFTPLLALWIVFWVYDSIKADMSPSGRHKEKWRGLKISLLSLVIAFGLSAFFTLPAFFEKGLVQTEALTRNELDFRAQFVKISQLFIDRSWNYSGSQPQSSNTISYQIGWPHWWLVFLSLLAIALTKKRKNVLLFTFLFLVFGFATYMTHNKSSFVWEKIKILAFVQFPWRFLSIVIFSASLIGGYFVSLFKGKWLVFISIAISVIAIVLNWQYFRPEHFYYDVTDAKKLSGQSLIDQQAGAILDYLPKTALEPKELAPSSPLIIKGSAMVTDFIKSSNHWAFNANVTGGATIDVPVFVFPNWITKVDGKDVSYSPSFPTGRIEINLQGGSHKVTGEFRNTSIRTFGNMLSLSSLVALLLFLKYGKNRKIHS